MNASISSHQPSNRASVRTYNDRLRNMSYYGIGFIAASCVLVVGCTASSKVSSDCCANYERPGFELSLLSVLSVHGF